MASRVDIVKVGPFHVQTVLWQPAPGAWAQMILCRSTIALAPMESFPAAQQGPRAALDPLERAIAEAPFKCWPEVLLTGSAYAREGATATSLTARIAVGDLDVGIEVCGDRYFNVDGQLSAPRPFSSMPIVWERAAGGPDTSNPVGVLMGPSARPDAWGRVVIPNLMPLGASVVTRDDVVAPAAFAPIEPSWPSRATRLHRAGAWDPERWQEQPLPGDVDVSFFNAAPSGQILEALTGEERLVLEHLHPKHPRLSTYLRATPPRVLASAGGGRHEVRLTCDTLAIDADAGTATLVWRGQLTVSHPDEPCAIVVSTPAMERAKAAPVTTLAGALAPDRAALPFTAPSAKGPLDDAPPPTPRMAPLIKEPSDDEPTIDAPIVHRPAQAPVLGRMTLVSTPQPAPAVLPFLPAPEEPNAGVPREAPPITPPLIVAPPVAPPPPLADKAPPWAPLGAAPLAPLSLVTAPGEAPAPPPLIGAQTAEMEPVAPALEGALREGASSDTPPAPEAPEVSIAERCPIARCGAIAAQIALHPDDVDLLLEREELRQREWQAAHAHWMSAIRDEAKRGEQTLLAAYDKAYVEAIEAARGPITAAEYARRRGRGARGDGVTQRRAPSRQEGLARADRAR